MRIAPAGLCLPALAASLFFQTPPAVRKPLPPPGPPDRASAAPRVLAEIDRKVREEFWDPARSAADWASAVAAAARDLDGAATEADRDAAYDRLLGTLSDSHTFRVPPGRLPETRWATCGLRIGRDAGGFAVKGVLPGSSAERAGMRPRDPVLAVGGRAYAAGGTPVNFRDLFLALEGAPGRTVEVRWQPADGQARSSILALELEPPGDTLFWKSARVIRRNGEAWGYARMWGVSAETALALVDLLSDREESARVKAELAGLADIRGFLLDVRGNSGGYDPGILATFLRGRWSAGDYWVKSRGQRRLVPPEYRPLPVALLVNSGTASSGEALALKFRKHGIGPIVGEATAGMLSGGAAVSKLSDGSSLWLSRRAIEDSAGRSYEGHGVVPDVAVPDRPPAAAGREDAIVEAAIRALEGQKPRR